MNTLRGRHNVGDLIGQMVLKTGKGHQVTFRKKIYQSMEALQADLDEWLAHYNHERAHQGKMCCGRTPVDTFADGKKIWQGKSIG